MLSVSPALLLIAQSLFVCIHLDAVTSRFPHCGTSLIKQTVALKEIYTFIAHFVQYSASQNHFGVHDYNNSKATISSWQYNSVCLP